MKGLLKRGEAIASEARRRRVRDVAEQFGRLLRSASIEVEEARMLVRGRGIIKRWLIDPSLRFLTGELK